MMIGIELKKLKSTGFFTSFFAGGILAALVPVANTAFRTELFTSMEGSPLSILLDANLQMMTMLFLILIICGACLMYHSEYADHAMRRMLALPLHPESLFFGKALILAAGLLFLLVLSSLSAPCTGLRCRKTFSRSLQETWGSFCSLHCPPCCLCFWQPRPARICG